MKFNIFVLSIIGSSNGEHFSRRLRKFSNEQPLATKNLEQQRTLTDDSSMSVEQVSYLEEQYSLSIEFGRGGGSSGRGGGSSKNPGKGKECSRKDQQIGAFLPTNGNVGIMFKIEAKEDLIIDGFSYLPDPDLLQSTSSYNDTVAIFTKCGDYVGDESIENKWDKIQEDEVEVNPPIQTTVSLPRLANRIFMSAGTVRSFHLTAAKRLAYANGDTEGAPYTYSLFPYQKEYVVEGLSSDIVLYQGKGCNGQFDCTLFALRPHVFVGVIDYCLKIPRDIEDTCFVDNRDTVTITVKEREFPTLPLPTKDVERTFNVFDPAFKGIAKRPLLIFFHGLLGNAADIETVTRFSQEAKDRGWIAAYPEGRAFTVFGKEVSLDNRTVTQWNGAGCCTQQQDDILFTKDMIDYIVKHYNADEEKVFIAGFSNGGFMVYRLLCEIGNRFNGKPWIRAAAAHSGLLGAWGRSQLGETIPIDFSLCEISQDVPFAHFHGTADTFVNPDGKSAGDPAFPGTAAVEAFQVTIKPSEWKSVTKSIDFVAKDVCNSTDITGSSNPTKTTSCNELCNGKVQYCFIEDLQHKYSGSDCELCEGCTSSSICDPKFKKDADATAYFANFFSEMTINDDESSVMSVSEDKVTGMASDTTAIKSGACYDYDN